MGAKQPHFSDDEDEEEEKPDIEAIEKQSEPTGEGEEAAESAHVVEPKVKADPDGHTSKSSKKRDPMELRIYSEDELAGVSRDRLVADVTILEGTRVCISYPQYLMIFAR